MKAKPTPDFAALIVWTRCPIPADRCEQNARFGESRTAFELTLRVVGVVFVNAMMRNEMSVAAAIDQNLVSLSSLLLQVESRLRFVVASRRGDIGGSGAFCKL